jgi:hypothetical protein
MTYEPPGPAAGVKTPPVSHAATEMADLHRRRLAACREGKWPKHSIEMWRGIARRALARPEGVSPAPIEQRALEVCEAAGVNP